ncbi:MAG TPA: Uma2 family endonuclease, partial [Blastocatellia bacterium]
VVLHFGPVLQRLNEAEFFEFCRLNADKRIERSADGDLIVMPPTGGETGHRNFVLYRLFDDWAERDGSGIAFDSSTGFLLPNGALRSPDLAWITLDRWNKLSASQRKGFIPLSPDFVVELRSHSDSLSGLRAKMEEYRENGARLGWLIDPTDRKIYLYDANGETILDSPTSISDDPVLPGFVMKLSRIWS